MKKINWKTVFRGLLLVAVFALFAFLLSFLNMESNMQETQREAWQPDARPGSNAADWEQVAVEGDLELYFQPSTTQVLVKDKKNGVEWRSNPENAAADPVAFGQNKFLVQSTMDVTYVDNQSNYFTVNSFQGSVQEGTYRYEYDGSGVKVVYQFGKQEFEIACYFGVEQDRFVARILNDQIVQHGDLQVASISFLPFFGAGSLEDEGYMIVPDGAGALIRFNNQKQGYQSYSQSVYGRNPVLNQQTSTLVTENATMPVFGVVKNNDAFFAVITQGEYQAEISAEVSRKRTSNNIAYSRAVYIYSETNTLLSGSANEELTTMVSAQHKELPSYEVSYFFLEKGAGYSEMATRYREYLKEERGMLLTEAESQKSVGLTFLGGLEVRKTLLGIPYKTVEKLTTFRSLGDRVKKLAEETSGSICVNMYGMEKGGTKSKLPTKVTYEGKLGGKKNYNAMVKTLEDSGIPFYPVYDPVTMKKSGGGYSSFQTARNISKSAALQYQYLLSSGMRDKDRTPDYLISPEHVTQIMQKLMKSSGKQGIQNIGIGGIGEKVYSDFNTDSVSRNRAGAVWEEALRSASEGSDQLLIRGVNAYTYPYADVITEVPVNSSQFDVEDEEVPFLQMVLSGCASLYSRPVNESGNVQEMLLRCAEYGVSPSFLCMTARADILQDTEYQEYYSIALDNWESTIRETIKRFDVLQSCSGHHILRHESVADGVYATTYADGSVVYVNYGEQEVTVDGVKVPARDFVKGGRDQ